MYYYRVDDDYNFVANSATDVTAFDTVDLFIKTIRINYIEYRNWLIYFDENNTFGNLTQYQKEVLAKNFATNKQNRDSIYTETQQSDFAISLASLLEEADNIIDREKISSSYSIFSGITSAFAITNNYKNPSKLDYDILGLNKKRTIIKGELRHVEYYKNYDASAKTYSDLVVSEFREYTRDEIGIALYRTQTSNWILNDGTTGLTMNFIKHYTPEEGIQEGINRRDNMVGFAKTTLLSGLAAIYGVPTNQTYAFDLLTSVKVEIDYFIQGYTQPLRDAISASTKGYMTEGIKVAVIEQLTF